MKSKLIILSSLLLFAACSKSKSDNIPEVKPADTEATTVKVMTYNIYGAREGGIPDLKVIAEVIKRANPDIVALQEVDKFTSRNERNGDIAKELGKLTGMEYFFAKAIGIGTGEYGDAVLSKLPIQETKAYSLAVTPELGGEIRSVARILVEKDKKQFYFISTHFDHLQNEGNRLKQARDFVTLAKSFDKPMIVGADFNALPTSEPMKILREFFHLGCPNGNCSQATFSTSNPKSTIDYLIYSPIDAFTAKSYEVYTWANKESDHFPVLATFIVK